MRQRKHIVRDVFVALAVIAIGAALLDAKISARSSSPSASKPGSIRVRNAYGNLPLSFEENRGQTDARVKFLARGDGYSLFLTSTEAVLKLRASSFASASRAIRGKIQPVGLHAERMKMSVVRVRLDGANLASQASGVERLSGGL